MAFSPDGARILTGSADNTARLWDAKTGVELAALKGHTDAVFSVAFSPDGARILTGSADSTARLWDHRQGQVLIEQGSDAILRCLTPDQRRAFQLSPEPPEWCYRLEKWPYDHVTLISQSLGLISSSDDKEAESVMAALKSYHPAFAQEAARIWADAYIARGAAALRDNNGFAAEIAFMKAQALDPSAKERIESEKADCQRDRKNSAAEAWALNNKAWKSFLAGKAEEGVSDAEGAVVLAPDNPEILETCGQIYLALGRFDEAFADLDKAIALGIQSPGTYYARGAIYEKRGQTALAIADYRKSLKLPARDAKWHVEAQAKAKARLAVLEPPAAPAAAPATDR